MASVSNVLFPILFADDTNVFLSGNNADELIKIMNIELIKIVDWLDCNKLSLNVSKIHYFDPKSCASRLFAKISR